MDDRTQDSLRRKLIKGSLSAPLVLTVGKAHAVAARTSFEGCFANNDLKPQPLQAVTEPDEVVRVTREVHEVWQLPTLDNTRPQQVEGQFVYGWDNQTLYRIDGARLTPQYDNLPGFLGNVQVRGTGRHVELLAYMDENGTIIGLAPQANGGDWAMKSCYASLIAGTRRADGGGLLRRLL